MSDVPTISDLAGAHGGENADHVARYQVALAFLQCGRFSWAEWSRMGAADRAAATLAGEHLARVRAVMVGNASRGRIEAASVLEPVDNGETLEQEVIAHVSAGG